MKKESIFLSDKGIFKRFLLMLRKAKIPYLWLAGYVAVSAVLSNVGISVTEYTAEMFAGNVGFTAIILPFLFYQLLTMLIGSVSGVLGSLCSARINRNFRRMVWTKIVRLPMSFYEDSQPKELVSRITTDITVMGSLVMQVFLPIITTGYTVMITLQKIGSYDSRLMLALVAVLPFQIVIAFIVGKLQFGISDKVNRKNAELTQTVAERANSMALIKSSGTEEKEYKTGKERMKALYQSSMVNTWVSGFISPVYAMAGVMQFIVIVMVGRGFYADGSLTLPQWIAYFGFATSIVNILSSYCGYWTTLKSSQGATNRIAAVMERMEEELAKGEAVQTLAGDIELREVTFGYPDKTVLNNLSVVIPQGKITALIGPSGSGKTTVLNLIERLYQPQSGSIFIAGQDINKWELQSYRRTLAYITQENILFSGTLRENLLYGIHRSVSEQELEAVCRQASLQEWLASLPQGYETPVGEGGSSLSGGQKQRIALARALLKKADCLLMDEGTAAMDITAKEDIWQGIAAVMQGKTVVMAAHDSQTVLKADYVIVIENGKVADAGTKEELKKRNGYYQALMGEKV